MISRDYGDGEWEVSTDGYEASFGDDEILLHYIVMYDHCTIL